ncbi:hypothetical protein JHK87_039747 [Glycine soja]|nr:hypothetical protein JHK87_039747 [Glycine soja]
MGNCWVHLAIPLPSSCLFAEHLLDPDQPTVTRALSEAQCWPTVHSLLSDYFTHTANASLLCSHLLKGIDRVRVKYRLFKTILQYVSTNQIPSPMVMNHLTKFCNFYNPFVASSLSPSQVWTFQCQCQCSNLQKWLESSRDKARAKLQLVATLKCGLTCLFVGLTSMNLASERKLAKVTAQLDATAKGTYIMNKDLETTSQLVARLNDELEYIKTISEILA